MAGEHVRISGPDGAVSAFDGDEVAIVRVVTTGDGPWQPDFFLAFFDAEEMVLGSVPQGAPGYEELRERVEAWEGFDFGAYLVACGSTAEGTFEVWRRRR